MKQHLERAVAALAAGDPAKALAPLVAAWRASRLPAVAELVERLGKLAPGPLETKLARRLPARLKAALTSLQKLLDEEDPRIATYFHSLVIVRPFGGIEFELGLLRLILHAEDPRSIEFLANQTALDGSHVRDKLVARFSQLPVPDPAEASLIRSIREHVGRLHGETDRGAELLAAIRAEPGDDRPRAIFADWLLERDDPYGEFIALQLAGATPATAREQALLRKHGKTWMGPLGVIADVKQSRFTRGFLSHLVVHYRALNDELAAVAGVAEWWSVEEIDRGDRLVPDPAMRSLRAIGVVNAEVAHRLANANPPLALTSLGIWCGFEPLQTAPGLPQLQHLTLVHHGQVTSSVMLAALRMPLATQLRSLAHQTARVRLTLSADRDGTLTQLRLDVPHPEPELVNQVRALVNGTAISRIELVVADALADETERLLAAVPGLPPLVVTAMR